MTIPSNKKASKWVKIKASSRLPSPDINILHKLIMKMHLKTRNKTYKNVKTEKMGKISYRSDKKTKKKNRKGQKIHTKP